MEVTSSLPLSLSWSSPTHVYCFLGLPRLESSTLTPSHLASHPLSSPLGPPLALSQRWRWNQGPLGHAASRRSPDPSLSLFSAVPGASLQRQHSPETLCPRLGRGEPTLRWSRGETQDHPLRGGRTEARLGRRAKWTTVQSQRRPFWAAPNGGRGPGLCKLTTSWTKDGALGGRGLTWASSRDWAAGSWEGPQLPTGLAAGGGSAGSHKGASGWPHSTHHALVVEFPSEENKTLRRSEGCK